MTTLTDILTHRFGAAPDPNGLLDQSQEVSRMAARGSVRAFSERPVPDEVIEGLCAVALASPTKSDLQQRDIVIVRDAKLRRQLHDLIPGHAWLADAPALLVFCGNNRRQRYLHERRAKPFANDHLDAFFNAASDAAIALATFVTAAEAIGLGVCPISVIRNRAEEVSALLRLPSFVFPFAGLAVGWPKETPEISLRLPLETTVHVDRFDDSEIEDQIDAYDRRRADVQSIANQRQTDRYGTSEDYTWSEDKARQYSVPDRADFGAFVRRRGFNLD
ncbi:MAG: nitroreductase family protein [Pseudomonadota bacterium]